MSEITSGKFLYGRTKNLGDFNSKKVEIELAFAVENNDHSGALKNVSAIAIGACEAILEGKAPPAGITAAAPAPAASSDKATMAAAALAGDPKPTAAKTRAKKPPAADPTPAAEDVDDGDLGDLLDPPPAEVTDADIQAKIVARAQATKNAPAIRLLVGKYVSPPKKATDIPQELRSKFLGELEAVPKVEA